MATLSTPYNAEDELVRGETVTGNDLTLPSSEPSLSQSFNAIDYQSQPRVSMRNVAKAYKRDAEEWNPPMSKKPVGGMHPSRRRGNRRTSSEWKRDEGMLNEHAGLKRAFQESSAYPGPRFDTATLTLGEPDPTLDQKDDMGNITATALAVADGAREGQQPAVFTGKRDVDNAGMEPSDFNPSKRAKLDSVLSAPLRTQGSPCHATKYKHTERCIACIAKKTGEPCRFRGLRAFYEDAGGKPQEPAIFPANITLEEGIGSMSPQYPTSWYTNPSLEEIARVKNSAARILLPVLKAERQSLMGLESKIILRKRESDVRVTCDRCLTSVFATSFICQRCGKEICLECLARFKVLGADSPNDPKLTICGLLKANKQHSPSHFLPISRFELQDLEASIMEMEILAGVDEATLPLGDGQPNPLWSSPACSSSTLTPLTEDRELSTSEMDVEQVQVAANVSREANVKGLPTPTFHRSELSIDHFRTLWRGGSTLVVTDLLEEMAIKWTPEYFIEHYGDTICTITDCDSETVHTSDVRTFFQMFGRYDDESRGTSILKLKDWPPSADFRETFPSLFEDFHKVVPTPNYTRRDGFENFSTHLPTNVIAPDMGPKMYNAFKSREEGYGSTRLHMDMADAVNIMLYAAPLPGKEVGTAIWDIYPASSSDKIRAFIRAELPPEKTGVQYVDPIHSQHFYLTPSLRKRLYDRYGVKGWRIHQKPGDAVFIPAGCAHQVCNDADCIKVAVDFVSPENLDRCAQLTQEFRNENEKVIWKEDILQLSNMCWSAWENTRRIEKAMK